MGGTGWLSSRRVASLGGVFWGALVAFLLVWVFADLVDWDFDLLLVCLGVGIWSWGVGVSWVICFGSLSWRRPWNEGWRRLPLSVISV